MASTVNALFLDIDGVLCFGRKHMYHLENSELPNTKVVGLPVSTNTWCSPQSLIPYAP